MLWIGSEGFPGVAFTMLAHLGALPADADPLVQLALRVRSSAPFLQADLRLVRLLELWPGSGHFPHLAHPASFTRLLAATGHWRLHPAPVSPS